MTKYLTPEAKATEIYVLMLGTHEQKKINGEYLCNEVIFSSKNNLKIYYWEQVKTNLKLI